ncbi:MAG TPA: hypothetical protein VJ840_16325 [Gemmatimonadaceae bacterium]|nr:hypothetical protein [Gemmatimonadaceae bacterium]
MHHVKVASVPILIAVLFSGCSNSIETACTQEFRPGLIVYVNDSLTNTPGASGASLVARDGSFKDSVAYPSGRPDLDASPLYSAGERPGTYQITVTKTGNLPWSMNNVRVTANQCHVNQVTLTARLVPQ